MEYFNIQVASQISGVTSTTIRAWEKRYNAIKPERASNRHRLYSGEDIEKIAILARLTEFGQSIGKIAHLELAKLKEIYSLLLMKPYEEIEISKTCENLQFPEFLQNSLRAIKSKKFNIIGHELEKVLLGSTPQDLCRYFIIPLITEVHFQVIRENLLRIHEELIKNLLHFFLGKIIWNQVETFENQDKVIIMYDQTNDLLPLMIGIFLIGTQKTPYFFKNEDCSNDLIELVTELEPSCIYISSGLNSQSLFESLNIKKIVLPGEVESFLYFLDKI